MFLVHLFWITALVTHFPCTPFSQSASDAHKHLSSHSIVADLQQFMDLSSQTLPLKSFAVLRFMLWMRWFKVTRRKPLIVKSFLIEAAEGESCTWYSIVLEHKEPIYLLGNKPAPLAKVSLMKKICFKIQKRKFRKELWSTLFLLL